MNNLPIYNKFYLLLKEFYKINHNTKKEYKYTIGEETISLMWNCLDLVICINLLDNDKKRGKIKNLSMEFDKLKIRLRMMHEIGAIENRQFIRLQREYTSELGRMLGGWLKWVE